MIYLILLCLACWILVSWSELYIYRKRLAAIPLRIHVNGIRGKSSIVRYVSAILRAHNYKTLAKTTGSAPRIIGFSGEEIALKRSGNPNIFEQFLLMKYFIQLKPQAVVIECMATNPIYAEWLEDKVMNSHIYIMTNVRIDHQDQLGYTIGDIAKSLSYAIPFGATVITGETNETVLDIFRDVCDRRKSRLICPCVNDVLSSKAIDTSKFSHAPILENIQVCLALAALLNISPDEALATMASTRPDPGYFKIKTIFINGTEVAWSNLFAVNDKESFIEWTHLLISTHASFQPVIILNNRKDRVDRVPVFVDCVKSLGVRRVVTMGDCEQMVVARMGNSASVLNLGNTSLYAKLSGEDLLRRIIAHFSLQRILLIGAVNIHTEQADSLLAFLEKIEFSRFEEFSEELY